MSVPQSSISSCSVLSRRRAHSQLHSFADEVASPAAPQAKVIDGKAISAEIRVELAEDVKRLQQLTGKVRQLPPAGAVMYLSPVS